MIGWTNLDVIINTSYQKLSFGSGDDPDRRLERGLQSTAVSIIQTASREMCGQWQFLFWFITILPKYVALTHKAPIIEINWKAQAALLTSERVNSTLNSV